jgi:hypothetical protein
MAETPEERKKRLAERVRVDAHFNKMRPKKKKVPTPKPTSEQIHSAKAKKRRDAVVASSSGLTALTKALTPKPKKKK